MNLEKYNESIIELIELVKKSENTDTEATKRYCKKLIELGKQEENTSILGFAYYYLAKAYIFENKYAKFNKYLILGLRYQQLNSMGNLLARSYNLLGINSDNQGDLPSAIDYYLTSINYSKENDLCYEEGLASCNIGQLYMGLKEYRKAIHYLDKARTCFEKEKSYENYIRNIAIVDSATAISYYRYGDIASALKYYELFEAKKNSYPDDIHFQLIHRIFEATFCNILEDIEQRDTIINELIVLIGEIPSLLDVYDEAFLLCDFLKEAKRYDDLWKVLDRMELLSQQVGNTNMQLRILGIKLECYQEEGRQEEYLASTAEYYQLSQQLQEDKLTSAKRAIELRIDMERIREKQRAMLEENKRLLEKSEQDPLTKLPNREKLNLYSEQAFEKAYQNKTSLAIEIFDIDDFKLHNDTYGHQSGDRCLKKIAQLLHNLIAQGIFCARYGGDEFIVIYENKSDDEVRLMTTKLQQDVVALNLENKNSPANPYITISQGICNAVPKGLNRLWDFFYAADMALYQGKRAGKNGITIVNRAPMQ